MNPSLWKTFSSHATKKCNDSSQSSINSSLPSSPATKVTTSKQNQINFLEVGVKAVEVEVEVEVLLQLEVVNPQMGNKNLILYRVKSARPSLLTRQFSTTPTELRR